jgi:hypothetical protein
LASSRESPASANENLIPSALYFSTPPTIIK